MKHRFPSIATVLLAGVALAAEPRGSRPSSASNASRVRDVCDHKSRSWSDMRATVEAISRYRGENHANVQQIAREALAGSQKFAITEFELQYARGKSGAPPP